MVLPSATVICAAPAELPAGVDVLLANILSGPLCALAERFAALVRPGGHVILSGLMAAPGSGGDSGL